ncbi:PfkB family carbohydrate kinase [Paraferrimonas haliotis]|uniref:PfkB family carbohydrate kinase n=1 Tax=Paraferrimonas haliotis TaxID=2013866 RepID=UPI000BA99DFD|nr:PfkB family carbohydrate kinase [Paraferrimonas haliotis]
MASLLVVANLNCDRVIKLDSALTNGGRHRFQQSARRLGGGAANTGIGLVWAGHQVQLVCQLGNDQASDWALHQAGEYGLEFHQITRHSDAGGELLLLLDPSGERTIVRPVVAPYKLGDAPNFEHFQAVYFNSQASNQAQWAQLALSKTTVVGQYNAQQSQLPCHYLVASKSDMNLAPQHDHWAFAKQYAGESLQALVLTDGCKGATLYTETTQHHCQAIDCEVVDTTGAGDTFAAGFIHSLIAQQPLPQALEIACEWAQCALKTASSIPGEALQTYLTSSQS